ncbi:hypothetical protein A4R29_31885 (plasmid) [Mesorhizobium ciceri biovar biserrulae]|nr:hypothetical protein A4R29_31885 [Mesorhizobium ciceri biovar biserrulae]
MLDDAGDTARAKDAPHLAYELKPGSWRYMMDDAAGEGQIEDAVVVWQGQAGADLVHDARIFLPGTQDGVRRDVAAVQGREGAFEKWMENAYAAADIKRPHTRAIRAQPSFNHNASQKLGLGLKKEVVLKP